MKRKTNVVGYSDELGDGKRPNLYFVTLHGKVHTVTVNPEVALDQWRAFSGMTQAKYAIEDRLTGVLASHAKDEETGKWENYCDLR